MDNKIMAPHEILHLRELLTFKNLCLTKAITMEPLATEDKLKEILRQSAAIDEMHIKELKNIIGENDNVLK